MHEVEVRTKNNIDSQDTYFKKWHMYQWEPLCMYVQNDITAQTCMLASISKVVISQQLYLYLRVILVTARVMDETSGIDIIRLNL